MPEGLKLTFESVRGYERGLVEHLLAESYAALTVELSAKQTQHFDWRTFDRDVFESPDTVGACTFITCLDGQVIGLGSFDPRPRKPGQRPERGIVGHNCILPAYRGQGRGKQQMQEILRRLIAVGIRTAIATTGEHPFFLPAQRMYLACGFDEAQRLEANQDRPIRVIEYQKQLV